MEAGGVWLRLAHPLLTRWLKERFMHLWTRCFHPLRLGCLLTGLDLQDGSSGGEPHEHRLPFKHMHIYLCYNSHLYFAPVFLATGCVQWSQQTSQNGGRSLQFAACFTLLAGKVCRDAPHRNPALYDVIKGSMTLLVLDSLLTSSFYPLTNVRKVKEGVICNLEAEKPAAFCGRL